ncbi:MAG: hypothetical protein NVSMB49_28290 [Ktedonobacteraceae bacterium]
MTRIFVSHTPEDTPCAEKIRTDLEAKGYTIWRQPESLQMSDILYPRTIETMILGSAAIILVWNKRASQSEWVERHVLLAQRLRKLLLPVLLDRTPLPITVVISTSISTQMPCTDVIAHLLQSSILPAPENTDQLIAFSEQAAHDLIRERKAAIDMAAEMLTRNEHREAVLAILEYLAHNDLMMGVREKAQDVIDADTNRQIPPSPKPLFKLQDSRHMFGVRCKNGHVTYFDKRRVCSMPKSTIHRVVRRAEAEMDELDLECDTCHEPITVRIDCEGYK